MSHYHKTTALKETEEIEILIIEDDVLTAESTRLLLQEFGFSVKAIANTIEAALGFLNKESFDIVLVDIDLYGKQSGIEIGSIISNQFHIPFIFITGITDAEIIAEAVKAKPAAYLVKPPNAATLFACIQTAIQNFSVQQVATANTTTVTDFFFIKTGQKLKKVFWNEVVLLSSTGNYTMLTTQDKTEHYLRSSLAMTLKFQIPQTLQQNFLQLSRSEAVHVNFITEIDEEEIVTPVRRVPLSKGFAKEIRQRLNILN